MTSFLLGFDCKCGVSANVNTVRDIIDIACETLGDTFDIILVHFAPEKLETSQFTLHLISLLSIMSNEDT